MIKRFSLPLLVLAAMLATGLGTWAAKYDYRTVEGDPLGAKIYTLPNGLKDRKASCRERV